MASALIRPGSCISTAAGASTWYHTKDWSLTFIPPQSLPNFKLQQTTSNDFQRSISSVSLIPTFRPPESYAVQFRLSIPPLLRDLPPRNPFAEPFLSNSSKPSHHENLVPQAARPQALSQVLLQLPPVTRRRLRSASAQYWQDPASRTNGATCPTTFARSG